MGWAHTGAEGVGRGQGRSWGLGTGLGILNQDIGVQQETQEGTWNQGKSQEGIFWEEKDTWKGKQGCPVLPGTGTEREDERGLGNGRGGHGLRSANRRTSHCSKVTENVFSWPLRAAEGAVKRHLHAADTPVSPKETSEKFLSGGQERKGPWLWAQHVALGHGPVTGVRGPGHAAGNRLHQARDHCWGQGAPLQGPSLRTHPAEPTASKMAHRCPLFEGIKDPSYKTSHSSVKTQCPHRWEACHWEKLGF